MVWDYDTELIVMLTQVLEGGRPKCDQYFPLEGTIATQNFEIQILKEKSPFSSVLVREFRVRFGSSEKVVKHV
jgi:protein tyrosine phosphatase